MSNLLSGCYMGITGHVIDAETQQPIEDAVVLVEWTKTHGIGDHSTESYKVADAVSGKDGKFVLPGCFSPFVNKPDMTIYKKGYVAWSSRWVFPDWQHRADFKWGNNVFKLEHFKEGYSYIDHTDFITSSINESINFKAKKNIYNAFSWEDQMASKERDIKARKSR